MTINIIWFLLCIRFGGIIITHLGDICGYESVVRVAKVGSVWCTMRKSIYIEMTQFTAHGIRGQ